MPSASSRNWNEKGSYMGMTFHLCWRTIFLSKIQGEECEIIIFSFICCQSLHKIQMDCLFSDWFCFNVNSEKFPFSSHHPFLLLLKSKHLHKEGKRLLLRVNRTCWAGLLAHGKPTLSEGNQILEQNRWRKKKAAVKTFSLFFSSTLAGPLAAQPPLPHDFFHPWLMCWKSRTLSVERVCEGEHSPASL